MTRRQRIRGRLAEAADRGIAHRLAQLVEQFPVPHRPLHQHRRLLGADAARRALAAALVLEEAHQVQRRALHAVLLRQDDDRGRADEAAVFFQRAEIERDVVHRGRQDAAGRAARQIGVEGVAVGHAAAEFVDQFAHGEAGRRELDAGILDAAGDRIAAQAVAAVAAVALPPVRALLDDVAHPEQRLDIVDQRRQAEQPDLERIRRLVPRQAALAFDAFQQRGFLAADIGAGAAAHVHARTARRQLGDFERQDLERGRIFVADVDVDVGRIDDMRADQRAFQEAVQSRAADRSDP